MSGPNFLGIGAQKAGTTWLHEALRARDDIFLPPVKELHFWDQMLDLDVSWINHIHSDQPVSNRWVRNVRKERRRRARSEPSQEETELRDWMNTFVFGDLSMEWYRSLFDRHEPVRGEITPAYAVLKEPVIERIRSELPDLRLVYLIRNPIEREWSSAQMALRRLGWDPTRVLRAARRRSRYVENVECWEGAFGAGSVFVGFYDDIGHDPQGLLQGVADHIGAQSGPFDLPQGRPNAGGIETMPALVAQSLATEFLPHIKHMATTFGGWAERWVQIAEHLTEIDPEGPDIPYPLKI